MSELDIQSDLVGIRGKLVAAIESDEKEMGVLVNKIKKNKDLLHAINGSLGVIRSQATGYGALSDTVRSVIKLLDTDRFTPVDIDRKIRLEYPTMEFNKEGIRTALWTFAKRKEIKLVKKGSNSAPAEYERIQPMHRYKRTTPEGAEQTLKNAANGTHRHVSLDDI